MAKLHVEWMEKKNNDWIVAHLKEGDKDYKEVSINRVNKKGETFPNFDAIMPGATIEGELWESSSNKWYLFAPKPETAPRRTGAGMDRIVEKKAGLIAESQEKKAQNIAQAQEKSNWMWSKRSAAELVAHHPAYRNITDFDIARTIQDLATEILNAEPTKPF